jgi:ectoine hydroxylase-related dioxygenase (phytanoyl-CoA dioxygenase family)
MSLTSEQVFLFRHNGFTKLPEPLPTDMIVRLKETILRDIRDEVAPVVRDRDDRVVRISNLWGRDPVFDAALTCAQVLDPLACLLGENIELILNRHNHATLRLASDPGNYFHRDILQWSRGIVTILFYLEDTTLENGCTWVVPGSHLLPGVSSTTLAEEESVQRSGVLDQAVPVPMPAGGLLALDSLVMHSPGENRTTASRMSMTAGYHSVDELSNVENPKRALVRGTHIYLGNDK